VEKIEYPYDTSTVFGAPSLADDAADEKIGDLLVVDYRYARFALDPRTGLFNMIRLVLPYLQDARHSLLVIVVGGIHPGRVWLPYKAG
jgi:hypothetical protein